MHHGETPALSQEQAAALPWLLQHFCERGARRRRRLVNLGAIPTSHPRPAWGQQEPGMGTVQARMETSGDGDTRSWDGDTGSQDGDTESWDGDMRARDGDTKGRGIGGDTTTPWDGDTRS